jgi:mRNA interferase MazF
MRRGEVYLVNLEPTQGTEANKTRPAIVVSNDAANIAAARHGLGVVTVVPVTSNVSRVYPFQVLLGDDEGGLDRRSKAQTEQLRAVDVARLGRCLGMLQAGTLRKVDDAIRLHLALRAV